MNRHIIRSMRKALDACAEINRRGLTIRSAHVASGMPLVTIIEPQAGAIKTFAIHRKNGVRTGVALIEGIRVEWEATIDRRTHQEWRVRSFEDYVI